MTIKDSDISETLERLRTSTDLPLKVEENESGFTLLLMDKYGNKAKEILGFSSTKSGIYTQLMTAKRVIVIKTMKQYRQSSDMYGNILETCEKL